MDQQAVPPADKFRLDGKVAVVTGAASGIGQAIAQRLAQQGAAVGVFDWNEAEAKSTAEGIGRGAWACVCDVSDAASVEAAFATLPSGTIDILVNCAGIAHVGTLLSTSTEDLDRLLGVNVRGTFLCMQAAVRRMQPQRSGVIVNLASIAASAGLPERFAYSATKGAVLSMTLSVARDYLADGIRCNCISPARVHTPFVDGFLAKNYPGNEAAMFAELEKSQPIGRMAKPVEIADLALYLCCDASGFATGTDYPLDGGFLNLR